MFLISPEKEKLKKIKTTKMEAVIRARLDFSCGARRENKKLQAMWISLELLIVLGFRVLLLFLVVVMVLVVVVIVKMVMVFDDSLQSGRTKNKKNDEKKDSKRRETLI